MGQARKEQWGSPVYIRNSFDCLQVMLELSVYEEESGRKPTGQISWWQSFTDHLTRMKLQRKYFISSWQKTHSCWPLFSWKTSTYQMSSRNTAERKSRSHLYLMEGDLPDTAGEEVTQRRCLLVLLSVNRGLMGDVMVGGSLGHWDQKRIVFNSWRRMKEAELPQAAELSPWTSRGQLWHV